MTVVAMVLAAVVTLFMTSVGEAWKYMLTLTAGVGLVMILRWYWWRINAWSEIAALIASAIVGSGLLRAADRRRRRSERDREAAADHGRVRRRSSGSSSRS